MPRQTLAALAALMLNACGGSTRSIAISPQLPPPPAAALVPCLPTPLQRQPDGTASSADAEGTIP